MVPLIFCYQTEQIKAKRLCYERVLLAIDLFVYAVLLVLVSCELGFREDSLGIVCFWSLLAISLTFALCLALRRVRKYSSNFSNDSGMQASKNLLLAH